MDFLTASAQYYIKRKQFAKAMGMAKRILAADPGNRTGLELLKWLKRQSGAKKK